MSLFTSKREMRLWLLTVFLMLGIYSTLGVAHQLVEILRDKGLVDTTLFFGFY